MVFLWIFGSFRATPDDFFAFLDEKGSPRGLQKHSARSPFWHPAAAPRPKASKTSPVALKRLSVALKTGPRATCNGSFLNGFWLNVETMLISFGMHLVWIWNKYLMMLEWIYAFERLLVKCFQAYSHIDITSPSIKYYDGFWRLYMINKQKEGCKSRWVFTDYSHNLIIDVYDFTVFQTSN